MTAKEIFEKNIPENLTKNAEKLSGINAMYQFIITGDQGGEWVVDLTKPDGGEVREGKDDAAQCTLTISDQNFVDLYTGKLNGQMAFMTGKLKVAGNIGLALKLQNIMGD
ncbi:MAG: SCP2 sterol-binding domain-containing protein [Deltaproteobacteria bacterium]|nr:SCP2 sterol-binding domain-containing protein [Deltaproteobacteria bacterium]